MYVYSVSNKKEKTSKCTFAPSFRQLLIMPVIRYDFGLRIDAFEQFSGRFVIRILVDELAMDGEVKNLRLCRLNSNL